MSRVGVMFRPEWPPEELPGFVAQAERDGFAEIWLVEDCFLVGGLTMAATALAVSSRVRVGIGLLPAAMRNAALSAMEIAGLGRLHPGRLAVAFGHGVDPWMRQIDARPPDRLAALEEVVVSVRSLLAGDEVTTSGSFVRLDGVRLAHVPDPPPSVMIGTTGPRALAMAGRAADGFLLAEGSGPAAVRWACETAGGGKAVVYAWLSIEDDRDAAAEALRPSVEGWRRMSLYPRLFELAGVDEGLDADRVRSLAVAGDPEDCERAVRGLWEAGADSVVLVPRHEDRADQVARFAGDVLPHLESA
jgi:5,10-methylenetetrahydromethanopterin reductase